MNESAGTFLQKTKAILSMRQHEQGCYPLTDLAERIEDTQRSIDRKILVYKWSSLIILILVPLISTSLSLLVTGRVDGKYVNALSYFLTFLTVFNSIFRPSFRFKELCEMGIGIKSLRGEFLGELETIPKVEEIPLHAMREKFDKLLVPYEKRLIALFLPAETVVEGGKKTRKTGG